MSTPVRVVYLAHTFAVGGAEEMVLNLVRHLPARFEPLVICIGTAGPMGEEMKRIGATVVELGLDPGIRRPSHVNRLRRYLRDKHPDIVHTFLLTGSLYGRCAAILAHVPIIIGTEVNIYEHKRRSHAIAERLLMRGTNRVVVSAEAVRDFYVRQIHADPAKVQVIYNSVDFAQVESTKTTHEMRALLGVPDEVRIVGTIARLTEQKGHRILFDALAQTPALASTHVLVIGDGELRSELEQHVHTIGIASRVHFLGVRRDLGDVLTAMDAFVVSSLWEGLPLALLLAMGAGLPVVATRVGGIPEVVEHERTGLLVREGDSHELGLALARIIAEPASARLRARQAQSEIRARFGVKPFVDSVVELYDQLLEEIGANNNTRRSRACSNFAGSSE